MDCFGYQDDLSRECMHCSAKKQCRSVRTTHGEEIMASFVEEILFTLTEEELANSAIMKAFEMMKVGRVVAHPVPTIPSRIVTVSQEYWDGLSPKDKEEFVQFTLKIHNKRGLGHSKNFNPAVMPLDCGCLELAQEQWLKVKFASTPTPDPFLD